MQPVTVTIQPATPSDKEHVFALLMESGLPIIGLDEHWDSTKVAWMEDKIIGNAALELYGEAALLRSVVVAEAYQGDGIGGRLIAAMLELAQQHGVRDLYLLTETAIDYFPRFGFRPLERTDVAQAVQQSVEFTIACPFSAVAMHLALPEPQQSGQQVNGVVT